MLTWVGGPASSWTGWGAGGCPTPSRHFGAGFHVSALSRYTTDVPEKWPEVSLHLAEPHSPLSQAQQLPPRQVQCWLLWSVPGNVGTSEHDSPHSWPTVSPSNVCSKPRVCLETVCYLFEVSSELPGWHLSLSFPTAFPGRAVTGCFLSYYCVSLKPGVA